jgi:hypothetical protein
MRRFVEGVDRGQTTLFPECLEDWIDEGNPVRAIDTFVEKLDLSGRLSGLLGMTLASINNVVRSCQGGQNSKEKPRCGGAKEQSLPILGRTDR